MSLIDSINLRQSSVHAIRPGTALDHEQDGRVCEEPGCTTQLSRYNPAPTCCRHEGWSQSPPARGTR